MDYSLTQKEVRKFLDYNESTGVFVWKNRTDTNKSWNSRYAGKVAGCKKPDGYYYIAIHKQLYYAHRLAWLYVHGRWPKHDIDHINGNPSDNRITNLRDVKRVINSHNRSKASKRNKTSGLLGVSWCSRSQRWIVQITFNRKHHYVGCYNDKHEAKKAYDKINKEMIEKSLSLSTQQ